MRLIEFDGSVDAGLMERAFRQMVARRLILRARVPATKPGVRPFFVVDDSVAPVFSVLDGAGPTDRIDVFHEELNTQLGVDGDPPIKGRLLVSDQPGGALFVSCTHAFCDGRSLFRFCRQLLSEYEALVQGLDGDPSIPATDISPALEDVLPEWATPEYGKALVADFFARQAELPRPMPWPSQRGRSTEPRKSHLLLLDVPAQELSAMRAQARANGTTVPTRYRVEPLTQGAGPLSPGGYLGFNS